MIRDEHRNACIEAICDALDPDWRKLGKSYCFAIRCRATRILDALNDVALIVESPKFNLAEIAKTLKAILKNGEIRDYDDEIANRIDEAAEFCIMGAVNNLTKVNR